MSDREIKINTHPDPYYGKHESHGYRREEKWTEAHEELCKKWKDQRSY